MIEETGIIIAVDGGRAEVLTRRRSSCSGCQVRGACGTSLLDRLLGRREVRLAALNRVGAGLGDEVVVGVPEDGVLIGAFVVYILPLLGLISGAILGQSAAEALGLSGQILSIIGGAGGLAVGLGWVRRFGRSRRSDPRFRAIVVRRAECGTSSVAVDLSALKSYGPQEK